MSTATRMVIAVSASLAAGCSFGVAAALQHQQARNATSGRMLRFGLLTDLARRPRWLAGIVLAAAAYALQGLALVFGPLALVVAPIVATDLLFAVPLAAWWSGRRLRGRGLHWLHARAGRIFLASSPRRRPVVGPVRCPCPGVAAGLRRRGTRRHPRDGGGEVQRRNRPGWAVFRGGGRDLRPGRL